MSKKAQKDGFQEINKKDGKTRVVEESQLTNETNELEQINILDYNDGD